MRRSLKACSVARLGFFEWMPVALMPRSLKNCSVARLGFLEWMPVALMRDL